MKLAPFCLLAMPLTASAVEEDPIQMQTVLVSDSKVSRDAPITAKDLDREQARDLRGTFRKKSEVIVGGGQGAGQKVYVRGVEDTQLNVTVDGARQSGYLFHHQGRLSLDPELLKRVDVSAGTGNALSGPGALGGSIRFETKDVEDLISPGRKYGAMAKSRFASVGEEAGASLALYTRPWDSAGLLVYGTFANSSDYRSGGLGGDIPYTAGKPRSGLAKVTLRPTEDQKISISANLRTDNARRLARTHFLPAGVTPAAIDQEFGSQVYAIQYQKAPEDSLLNFKSEVYGTRTELRHIGGRSANSTRFGGLIQNNFDLGRTQITAGLDVNQDRSQGQNTTGSNQETGSIFGVYAQAENRITDRLTLGGGLRADQYSLQDVSRSDLNHRGLSPNLIAGYQFTDSLRSYISWTRAFRGATPSEAFLLGSANRVEATPNLRGTVAQTTEVGLVATYQKIEWSAVSYWTAMKHPLESSILRNTGALQRRNVADISVRGFNLGAKYRIWNPLAIRGTYAANTARFGEAPLGYVAFNRGNAFGDRVIAGFDVEIPKSRLMVSWDSILAMPLTDVPAGSAIQPGYAVYDLSVTWSPEPKVQLALALHNLFDRQYIAQGTPYQLGTASNLLFEPGRDIRFTASVFF